MQSDPPVLIFPDDKECGPDRPCRFHRSLLTRKDVVPVLLRPRGLQHSEEHLTLTQRHTVIEVDLDLAPSVTAAAVAETLATTGLTATDFCCMSEPNFEYWAALGRLLGLPAPSAETARAVRHKPTMKQKLVGIGLSVAAFVEHTSREESRAFAELWGYPVVGKPVDGYGSRLTEVIVDGADLDRWIGEA